MARTKSPTSNPSESPIDSAVRFSACHLDDGDIRTGIRSDALCRRLTAVAEGYDDVVRTVYYVIIGKDQSLLSIDDHTGAGRLYLTIGGKIACAGGPSWALAGILFQPGAASDRNVTTAAFT
jgi:hypothetical protein